MKSSYFQFQAFRVRQSHSAMKIGTDGVLLGAWAQLPETCKTVLDIGTGTGLLFLMLAQRYAQISFHAIEIDAAAAAEAQFNFEQKASVARTFTTGTGRFCYFFCAKKPCF